MSNWLSKEFLLAVIGALTITAVVLSVFGPPHYIEPPGFAAARNDLIHEPSVSDSNPTFQIECNPTCAIKYAREKSDRGKLGELLDRLLEDPVIGLAAGSLIANFLLVFAVLRQIGESRKSNEALLRAYVVNSVGLQFRQGGIRGLKFEFRPVILNTGQTPAYALRTVSRIRFMSLQEAAIFDFAVNDPGASSQVTLGPRQDRFVHTIYEGYLSKAELRQYKRMEKPLYVYGTTWYRDAFGRARYTNHCYVIGWWSKRGQSLWQTVARHSDSN
jgi:hypothetical protein